MAKRELTDDVLREASNHLQYEYWMLVSIANALASGASAGGWLNNALIESFAIHYRALYDFFYSIPKGDDAYAGHYFDSEDEWEKLRPPETDLLKKSKRRTAKEIAHLTYSRLDVTEETKNWLPLHIVAALQKAIKVFLENVPADRLGERWNQTIPGPFPLLSTFPPPAD